MCRWFAYISPTEPCLLEDILITPNHSLVKQVHDHYLPGLIAHHPSDLTHDVLLQARNSVYNIDGLGVAWYTSANADFERGDSGLSGDGSLKEGLRPACYKTIVPPINDINFRSICANTETRVCFAHIRAASATPIVHVNNHPFIFGRHIFMHNGVVSDFNCIRRAVCGQMCDAAHDGILGSTDSEHIAALYMTNLTKHGDKSSWELEYSIEEMAQALHKAVETIINMQIEILGSKRTPNSLNLCVTDGIKLVAYRFRNHVSQEPPSLYYSEKAGVALNRKYEDHPDGKHVQNDASRISRSRFGEHLIVASEPSTHHADDWILIGKNQVLLAEPRSKVLVRDVPYDSAWNAVDPTVK
ncbi:hypothetical protein H2198_000846 [Neophaeococcomyces mojaviensis]|uniref:Uncharacterized protein n=1 Tax=Neophaeococcomyces mojaviensis TaxID=3383035 RepID=A0ACC3AIM8_9EURO|nr:hypothetical protein H2198_000846 [Knufia sp. JES_112]